MIRPANRLVLATAFAATPLCALIGSAAGGRAAAVASITVLFSLAVVDAIRVLRSVSSWRASTPADVRWFKDRTATAPLTIEGVGKQSGFLRVHPAFPPQFQAETACYEVHAPVTIPIVCVPLSRGDFQVTMCHVESASPWGLWRAVCGLPINLKIRVYPDQRGGKTADFLNLRQQAGMHGRRQIGKGREFEKLRDYVSGDSFEDIDWKATARRRFPVVKVHQIEQTQEIYTVLDSSRLSARAGLLEHYVTASLSLARMADAQHDRFGLATFSARVDKYVPAGSGKTHFSVCREAIYGVQALPVSPDAEEVFSFLRLRLRKRSLIIFLTDLDDPMLAEAFVKNIRVLSRRHLVLVNLPEQPELRPLFSGSAPESEADVYSKLAGHTRWNKVRELQRTLKREGVRLTMFNPTELPRRIAEQYLDVKRRQLI